MGRRQALDHAVEDPAVAEDVVGEDDAGEPARGFVGDPDPYALDLGMCV